MVKAVIDIGTNTIHLLIADVHTDNKFSILKRESRFIRIAQDGIDPISAESIERALYCLHDYTNYINQYDPETVDIIGTEALRSATNQLDILTRINDVTGREVRIVSGDEEAWYIYAGCRLALPALPGNFLIMDIGGGSVEFILADQDELIWKKSYKIGVQYLYTLFQPKNPNTR